MRGHVVLLSMSMASPCDLKVVLLCKGRGADAASYRPNRDESQWWSRRDALVRCVTAFLFGPSTKDCKKELVLLFDDDLARIHMTVEEDSDVIPSEQAIVSLWKQAAQQLNKPLISRGLTCHIVMDPLLQQDTASSASSSLPTGMDSKRHVLEYLQKKCAIDFLRSHGLNSSASVILRKTNKKALMDVWNEWRKLQKKRQPKGSTPDLASRIESIYFDLLPKSTEAVEAVAGTLHEKFEELPCFGLHPTKHSSGSTRKIHLCLFLGAVRDMFPFEYEALNKACDRSKIPMAGIRLGTVPEFTSKILSVLSFHHSQGVLAGAIERLVDPARSPDSTKPIVPPSCLHVVCAIPMPSSEVSTDLRDRNRIHWALVRVIVCTLWRSKLMSSSASASSHENSLNLVFEDGVVVALHESEFVAALAEQHQAAPCEYQILTALKEKLATASPPDGNWSKTLAIQAFQNISIASSLPVTCTISIELDAPNSLAESFYSLESSNQTRDHAIIIVLDILAPSQQQDKARKIQDYFLRASHKANIPVLRAALVAGACQDREASTIIALQHFCYQSRMFASCQHDPRSGKKRKKHSK